MAENALRITTVDTAILCARLGCICEPDNLDEALSEAGYVRLDHGLKPGTTTAIMTMDPPAGKDPGHRAPAIAVATSLFYIIHADGRPEHERLGKAAHLALSVATTDSVGEKIVLALAAYCANKDPEPKEFDWEGPFGVALVDLANAAYETARNRNVVTDVALERAQAVGAGIPGWREILLSKACVTEPVVRVRRHDPEDYEKHGITPPLAELITWIKANPTIDTAEFVRYARLVGVDPKKAGLQIAEALKASILLKDCHKD